MKRRQKILLFLFKRPQEGDGVLTVQSFCKIAIPILKNIMLAYSFDMDDQVSVQIPKTSCECMCVSACVCMEIKLNSAYPSIETTSLYSRYVRALANFS